ncbi:hypothetical protein TEA_019945 [Camellia sinensis var. sinensis]|uniref:Uncharacterized protein n=1 Tax=Camellia sinensis var. sinensis TaxID=542762 RepID=A0A4S4F3C6_CAMSN|nr:hypothetical protein TEA_019945 [Camellia sinensis var. sinensis]
MGHKASPPDRHSFPLYSRSDLNSLDNPIYKQTMVILKQNCKIDAFDDSDLNATSQLALSYSREGRYQAINGHLSLSFCPLRICMCCFYPSVTSSELSVEISVDKEELEGSSYKLFFFLISVSVGNRKACSWNNRKLLKVIITLKFFLCLDAKWHSREDVKKALTFAEYKKAQTTAAAKVAQMCKGVEKGQNIATDFNVESGDLAPMFVPGPFAIAHHLITTWVYQDELKGVEAQLKQPSGSLSNL